MICDYCWTADARHTQGCTDPACPCLCDGFDGTDAAAETLAEIPEGFVL